jgi:hypothetical protein
MTPALVLTAKAATTRKAESSEVLILAEIHTH